MKKTLLSAVLFCAYLTSNAQCDPVTTFNQNFETFTNGPLPQNCWTANTGNPKLNVATVSANKLLQAYSFMSPTAPIYIVSPELTTIDGSSMITFDTQFSTGSAPGNMTIEVGTLAAATNYASFQAIGSPITVTSSLTNQTVNIPATTDKFIAFKIVADAQHVSSNIDNITYIPRLNINKPHLDVFSIYPNPSTDKKITIASSSLQNDTSVIVYTLTGAKVYETVIDSNSTEKTLYLSDLSAGAYILKLQSGDYNTTKKLILK